MQLLVQLQCARQVSGWTCLVRCRLTVACVMILAPNTNYCFMRRIDSNIALAAVLCDLLVATCLSKQ